MRNFTRFPAGKIIVTAQYDCTDAFHQESHPIFILFYQYITAPDTKPELSFAFFYVILLCFHLQKKSAKSIVK